MRAFEPHNKISAHVGGRTPGVSSADEKSARAWEAAKRRIPFGVNSNYRLVDPYPLYVRKAKGSRIWDVDGNEYVDFNMAFGALVAGHSHPLLAKAMRERVSNGTIFGYESVDAGRLAEHMCQRFQIDRLKFSMTVSTRPCSRSASPRGDRPPADPQVRGLLPRSHDALMVSIKLERSCRGTPSTRTWCHRRRAY